MSECKEKRLIIVQGDFTGYGDVDWLTLRPTSDVWDLSTMHATFELNGIVKQFDDLTEPLSINYEADQTAAMPLGDLDGVLRFYDANNKPVTVDNLIPVKVVKYVHGDAVATSDFEMNIEVKQGGENILNIDVEAGVSVEVGSTETLPAGSDATVENVGTPNHLVLKFGIPQGEKGEDGAEGREGPRGPAGKDGVDGKDAKINGVNTLTLNATNGLTLTQNGNVATISGKTIQDSVTSEALNRSNADTELQRQIDAIVASSDVTDIVGTYAQLLAYDTSTLPPNSIIKVLQDESRDNETTYYRWVITEGVGSWVLIGEEGPYYTKSESDGKFVPKTTTINGKALSENISLDANDVGAATSVQGAKADTAVQPSDLGTAAYASTTDFATSTQGTKADSAIQGVQINGTDLTPDENNKVNIPVATGSVFGVVKCVATYGISAPNGAGIPTIVKATDADITEKDNNYKPIVPANLDLAVREGLGNNSLTWTDAYKTSARNTIGAEAQSTIQTLSATDSITLADNTLYRGGEQTSLTFALPNSDTVDFVSQITFKSGSTPTAITVPQTGFVWDERSVDLNNGAFVPVANKNYTIIVWYNGFTFVGITEGV